MTSQRARRGTVGLPVFGRRSCQPLGGRRPRLAIIYGARKWVRLAFDGSPDIPLPGQPDLDWVNDWLHRSYPAFWAGETSGG